MAKNISFFLVGLPSIGISANSHIGATLQLINTVYAVTSEPSISYAGYVVINCRFSVELNQIKGNGWKITPWVKVSEGTSDDEKRYRYECSCGHTSL